MITHTVASDKPLLNNRIFLGTMTFGGLAFTTLLVLGILGSLSVIALPTGASYAMIGIGAFGVLGWVVSVALFCLSKDEY